MEEFEIIKKLEYLITFQNECLHKGDFENFDKTENEIKKLEESLIKSSKESRELEDAKMKNILDSLESVSNY
jgi:hypothetical protein